jgi:uncharacterized membrane protein
MPPPPPGGPGGPGGSGGSGGAPLGGGPESYSVGNAVSYGWNKFKDNAAPLVLLTLVVVVGVVIVQLIGNAISGALLGTAETVVDPETGQFTTTGGASFATAFIVSMLFAALSAGVQLALQVGIIKGSLQLSRGQGISVGNAFAGINWGQVVLTAVLIFLGTVVGLILCVLPGLIWIFLTSYSLYYVVDRDMGAVDAIKASINMVTKNLGPLILFWLASVAITILGVCACGVGVLVAYPVVILAQAYTFRTFNNDPVTV